MSGIAETARRADDDVATGVIATAEHAPHTLIAIGTDRAVRCDVGVVRGGYRELIAWQRAMDLAEVAYAIAATLPSQERFALGAQMRRSAASIPSNIAEGHRHRRAAYAARLEVALGEHAEVETQILLARRLGYIDEQTLQRFEELSSEVGRLMHGLLRALRVEPPA